MDLWKGLVALQAAVTELRVAGLAQWVCFVCDRWQEKSLLRERIKFLWAERFVLRFSWTSTFYHPETIIYGHTLVTFMPNSETFISSPHSNLNKFIIHVVLPVMPATE